MILLNEDWTFTATDADCDIGYAGENGVRTLYIRMNGLEYEGWSFFSGCTAQGTEGYLGGRTRTIQWGPAVAGPHSAGVSCGRWSGLCTTARRRPGWAGQKIGSTAASRPMQHRPGGGGSLAASLGVCRV